MEENIQKPFISICIPTYNRPYQLIQTIESIFIQAVDKSLLEVCISDDSTDMRTHDMIQPYLKKYKNLHYEKIPEDNLGNYKNVLKMASGKLLKFNNDYSAFEPESCQLLIDLAKTYNENSLVFFGNQYLKRVEGIKVVESWDDFIKYTTYWSSWISTFALWKKDFDNLDFDNVPFVRGFPHTSILFLYCDKKEFIIDNRKHIQTQSLEKKGGYNIPEVFGGRFVKMIENFYIQKKVSKSTLELFKKDIVNFLVTWYMNVKMYPEKYTYTIDGIFSRVFKLKGIWGLIYFMYKIVKVYIIRKYRALNKKEKI